MSLLEAVSLCSTLSLIAGTCILLQAWCLQIEVKDTKGFYLAGALLLQFILPLVLCRLFASPGQWLQVAFFITAATAITTAVTVLIVNRHRIPDLTVYSIWSVIFATATYFIQTSSG